MDFQKLVLSIKENEGLKLKPYRCTEGKLTIGYGRNLEHNGISENEALEMLVNDVVSIKKALASSLNFERAISFINLPDHVQNVLVEMAYQMGVNGLLKFRKTLSFVKNGQYEKASIEMLNSKWARQTPNRAKKLSNLMKGGF